MLSNVDKIKDLTINFSDSAINPNNITIGNTCMYYI